MTSSAGRQAAKRKRRGTKYRGGEYFVILHQFGTSCLRASWARGVVFILEQTSEELSSLYSALFYSRATHYIMNHIRKPRSPTSFPTWRVTVCMVLPQLAAVLHLRSPLSPCSFTLSLSYIYWEQKIKAGGFLFIYTCLKNKMFCIILFYSYHKFIKGIPQILFTIELPEVISVGLHKVLTEDLTQNKNLPYSI